MWTRSNPGVQLIEAILTTAVRSHCKIRVQAQLLGASPLRGAVITKGCVGAQPKDKKVATCLAEERTAKREPNIEIIETVALRNDRKKTLRKVRREPSCHRPRKTSQKSSKPRVDSGCSFRDMAPARNPSAIRPVAILK
jgi:hypothetical protein